MKKMKSLCLLALASLSLGCVANNSSDWPQAAGPDSSWTITTNQTPPTQWSVSQNQNIAWQTDLPEGGQSGICISGNRIFLTVMKPIHKINVKKDLMSADILGLCVDRSSGKILWQKPLKGSLKSEMMYGFSDSSTPSPVADGKHVWFTNASGALACYDYEGNLKWSHTWQPIERLKGVHFPFNKQFEPMIWGDLIINMESATKEDVAKGKALGWNYLYARNKHTGKLAWISQDAFTHYNTPYASKLADGTPAVLIGRGGHHQVPENPRGYSLINLKDGKRIWQYKAKNGMALYNSIWNEKFAVWMTYDNEIHLLDANTGKLKKKISLIKNVDYRKFNLETGKHVLDANINFKNKYKKNIFPAWFTNIVKGDHLYFMCFKKGRYNQNVGPEYCFARVNLKTDKVEYLEAPVQLNYKDGKKNYIWHQDLKTVTINTRGLDVSHDKRSRRDGWHWNFNGNPIAVNNVLYFTTMGGVVHCFDANAKTWDENAHLSLNDLGGHLKTWSVNTPSYADGKLYHRTLKKLICIE